MDSRKINRENKDIWDANAANWNMFMGEHGNDWHLKLIGPQCEELLNLSAGERLLDVGCGNGLFARRMAQKGMTVTAADFSDKMIALARTYDSSNINYIVADACSPDDLLSLPGLPFHGIVANMLLMDMPDIAPLFANLPKILQPGAAFVFSIQHPAFNSNYCKQNEQEQLVLSNYAQRENYVGMAIPGQEIEQHYFHRSISEYMQEGFKNGLQVDGFIESGFAPDQNPFWAKFPPILLVRMRKI